MLGGLGPPSRSWADITADNIRETLADADTSIDIPYLVGTWLNDVREVKGREFFTAWLEQHEGFGLSDYKRQKWMRLNKG